MQYKHFFGFGHRNAGRHFDNIGLAASGNRRGQIFKFYYRARTHHDGAFQTVAKLAYIARPIEFIQSRARTRIYAFNRFSVFFCELLQKSGNKQGNVVAAVAKRRHVNVNDIEPVIQIFAETSGCDFGFQIAVGCRYNAHVDFQRFFAADSFKALVLQHAQNLYLNVLIYFADFIQKNGTAVCKLEAAPFKRSRAGKRAFFVAEQFAFQKIFRQSGAVNFYKRIVAPGR